MQEKIFNQLTEIFRDIFDNETLSITEETNAEDIEDWDSFEHINLINAIENAFSIKFDIRDVADFRSVGNAMEIIQRKTGQKE